MLDVNNLRLSFGDVNDSLLEDVFSNDLRTSFSDLRNSQIFGIYVRDVRGVSLGLNILVAALNISRGAAYITIRSVLSNRLLISIGLPFDRGLLLVSRLRILRHLIGRIPD